jgi:hypothetical protein
MGIYIISQIGLFDLKKQNKKIQTIYFESGEDPTDTLKSLYSPPLRYNNAEFRQIGYINRGYGRLPLIGKQLRRDKWLYFTMDGGIKISVEYNKRKCTTIPGCDSLSDGDMVTVDGYDYKVTLYDNYIIGY